MAVAAAHEDDVRRCDKTVRLIGMKMVSMMMTVVLAAAKAVVERHQ